MDLDPSRNAAGLRLHRLSGRAHPHLGLTAAPTAPGFASVTRATPTETNPFPLLGMPSSQSLELAAVGHPSRVDAERFALEVANFVVDVRTQFDDTRAMWLSSRPDGPSESSLSVDVEIAGQITGGTSPATWLAVRVDVERRDGGWRLADLSAQAVSGAPTGTGWRELSAGRSY